MKTALAQQQLLADAPLVLFNVVANQLVERTDKHSALTAKNASRVVDPNRAATIRTERRQKLCRSSRL